MSTTAARIPAFRECILPAGWDMARPPPVPGRALALPPRAPAGPAPRALRRLLPALAPAPRPPAARLAWAPPRLGAPRGSGDWALTSRRPSASPQGPRGGRRPLPEREHFQSSLRARPGRVARGLPLRRAARAGTPPWPRLLCPAPGTPAPGLRENWRPGRRHREAVRSRSALPGARRSPSPSAPRRGFRPPLASPLGLLLCAPRPPPRPCWPGRAPSLGKGG